MDTLPWTVAWLWVDLLIICTWIEVCQELPAENRQFHRIRMQEQQRTYLVKVHPP